MTRPLKAVIGQLLERTAGHVYGPAAAPSRTHEREPALGHLAHRAFYRLFLRGPDHRDHA